jgi:Lsr2
VNVFLVDDINGSDAEETIGFSLDGTHYEIDLNSGKNAGQEAPLVKRSMPAGT